MQFGKDSEEQQFFLMCERVLVTEIGLFVQAILALLAAYYVFEIAHPKTCTKQFTVSKILIIFSKSL